MSPAPGITSGGPSTVSDGHGLYTVSSGGQSPECDIVFIHGLQGHHRNTWTRDSPRPTRRRSLIRRFFAGLRPRASREATSSNPDPSPVRCFWPEDLLARDFPKARIFTFGYDSAITHLFRESANHGSILDYSVSLLQRLSAERKNCPRRPLIFIAHSLGGLVVKDALRQSRRAVGATAVYAHILTSTKAVLFFGTPHRGSDWTESAKGLERMIRMLGLSTTTNNLDALTRHNDLSRVLMQDFRVLLDSGHFHITSYYEQKGCVAVKGLHALIVDPDSAKIEHKLERSIPIDSDHRNMCKFGFDEASLKTYEQCVKSEISGHLDRSSMSQRHEGGPILSGPSRTSREPGLDVFTLELRDYRDKMSTRAKGIDDAHEGTLSWLLDPTPSGPGLQSWLSTGKGIYWIQGLPGSGKSTAMKSLALSERISSQVQGILNQSSWSYAFLFPTDRMGKEQKLFKTVLAAMVHWLWFYNPDLSSIIQSTVVGEDNASNLWHEKTLKSILLRCKNQTQVPFQMCFFIDAIDEVESEAKSPDGMIQFMKDLVSDDSQGQGRFKLCVASRPENEIAIHLRDFRGLQLQNRTGDDIDNFVHARLGAHPSARATRRSGSYDETLQQICQDIIGAAQGVFLWVRVVVDNVLTSQTRGESLSEIRRRILELRNEDLSQYFISILQRTPTKTRKLTNALFQLLMASHEPLSIMTVAVLLDVVSERQEPQARHSFTEDRLLELSTTSSDISRRISDLTGGLVQVISDDRDDRQDGDDAGDTDDTDVTRLPGSSRRETSGSHRKIRFLHQSVKDFLQESDSNSSSDRNHLLSMDVADPMSNGHILNLCIVDAYLGLSPAQRRPSGWTLNAMEITMHHAPATDNSLEDSSFELLLRISRDLSQHYDYTCGKGMPAWNTTLLAFAVAHRMHNFVRKCLCERGFTVRKKGRPLLHYAAWAPGCYPDVAMARILLDAGASLEKTFKDAANHQAKTALESLNFEEMGQDEQAYVDFIKFCIKREAKVSRHIFNDDSSRLTAWLRGALRLPLRTLGALHPDQWTTVLHKVAEGSLCGTNKMEILEGVPQTRLNHKRSDGFTVFGLLFKKNGTSGLNCITVDDAEKLIDRGAIITRRIVDMGPPTRELVRQHSRYSDYRHGAWKRRIELMENGVLG